MTGAGMNQTIGITEECFDATATIRLFSDRLDIVSTLPVVNGSVSTGLTEFDGVICLRSQIPSGTDWFWLPQRDNEAGLAVVFRFGHAAMARIRSLWVRPAMSSGTSRFESSTPSWPEELSLSGVPAF